MRQWYDWPLNFERRPCAVSFSLHPLRRAARSLRACGRTRPHYVSLKAPSKPRQLLTACRKFGKQIQKRQLEVPEYAASFVNYKALKKVTCLPSFLSRNTTPPLHTPRKKQKDSILAGGVIYLACPPWQV